ncbi:MAG: prepilin-type N-terminal cleavage/methylation domain-containing protein [Pseudomonadota bacterium]
MPISQMRASRATAAENELGVTLIELLVVMAIMAMAAAVVLVTGPAARSDVRLFAEQFAFRVSALEELAQLTGAPARVTADGNGYRLEHFSNGVWEPASLGRTPSRAAAPRGVSFSLDSQYTLDLVENERAATGGFALGGGRSEDTDTPEGASVVVDPAGLPTTFSAVVAASDEEWRVTRDENGQVSVEKGAF